MKQSLMPIVVLAPSRYSWRQKAKYVMGVEIVPQAIEDAKRNAELNGLSQHLFRSRPSRRSHPTLVQRRQNCRCLSGRPST